MSIFYVAAFVDPGHPKWFSVGRHRKIEQVLSLLTDIGFTVYGLNIAPVESYHSYCSVIRLCHSSFAPIRFIELVLSSFSYFYSSLRPRGRSPIVLWIYNARTAESLVALTALLLFPSLKLVIQLEDLPFARKENHGLAGLIDLLAIILLSKRADYILSVSDTVYNSLATLTGANCASSHLLPPVLDPRFLSTVSSRLEPFSHDVITIFYAGSYLPEKGVDDLLAAFSSINNSNYKLVLAGSAPTTLTLRYKESDHILFTGFLDSSELFSLYSTADVIVNPHRPTSNSDHIFPHKLVELVASGALPLTTRYSGAESFYLPSECYFNDVTDLALKLQNVRLIWKRNQYQLMTISTACRQAYSAQSVRATLSQVLGHLV
jgi:glycosyltransferase involved in cell wall biosynthesis